MRFHRELNGAKGVGLILTMVTLGTIPALAQTVGTAAAVNPASTGKPPGGSVRTLTIGSDVVHNERIHTDAAGSVQLLFVDKTAMSIGPNSDVTIDEYVFDPNTNTGRMAVTVGKGVMRFVGGQVSHDGEATVTTPSASIGIRGGTAIFDARGTVINLYGRQTITARDGTPVSLYRPGAFVNVGRGGAASSPGFASAQMLAAYNSAFEAKPGQTGGRRDRLTRRQVDALLAHNVTGSITPRTLAYGGPTTCHDPSAPRYMQVCTTFETTAQAIQQSVQSAAALTAAGQLAMPRMPPRGR
ncbi:MAG: FecR domain-containing protein [Xanthobacteraceae bacterium]